MNERLDLFEFEFEIGNMRFGHTFWTFIAIHLDTESHSLRNSIDEIKYQCVFQVQIQCGQKKRSNFYDIEIDDLISMNRTIVISTKFD